MAGGRSGEMVGARIGQRGGREAQARLADGRRLAYVVHGDESGFPVVLQHGTPGCRLGMGLTDAPARARGVRVICPDRPGIGQSDPASRRTLLGWADDVAELVDSLGSDRFAVVGWSGGGPHALACAAHLRGRVSAVGLMAGSGRLDHARAFEGLDAMDRWFAVTSARRPRLAALALRLQAVFARRAPGLVLRALLSGLGEADRRSVAASARDLMAIFPEAFRQGPDGVIDDYRRWIAPWPFALDAIDVPVDVWQGDEDSFTPMHHAEDLVARLPHATLHRLPGEGHFSIAERFDLVLDRLLAAGTAGARH